VLRSRGGVWSDIAAMWGVADAVGAPLADALRTAAAALRDASEVRAEVAVALAEPIATARLLTWLPLLGLPLGAALGLNPLRILDEPLGVCALVLGLGLVGASRFWTLRLARHAQPGDEIPGWDGELLAVALSSGASIERACSLVGSGRGGPAALSPGVGAALDLSARAGAPAVELLRGEAWLARHRARTRGREGAARLSTRLLVPLGVCTLPAFLLLAVVPAVLGVIRSTVVAV
jgi:tight adherence protein B